MWVPSVPEGKIPSTNHPYLAELVAQAVPTVFEAPLGSWLKLLVAEKKRSS